MVSRRGESKCRLRILPDFDKNSGMVIMDDLDDNLNDLGIKILRNTEYYFGNTFNSQFDK